MALRKHSKGKTTSASSPLIEKMDTFHNDNRSYGLNDNNNNICNNNSEMDDTTNKNDPFSSRCTNADENDYDGDKEERRSSIRLLGSVLPSITPSRSWEIKSAPSSSSQHHSHGVIPIVRPSSSSNLGLPFGKGHGRQPNSASSCSLPQSTTPAASGLPPPFVIQVTVIASLGGVLFGYDMGVIAGALPQLKTNFNLTSNQEELVVSILYLGGGLGAALGGTLCDVLGRKIAILLTDIGFMVGALVLFTAPHVTSVCVGRVIVGFAVAVSGIADVSYLHEIAPTQWRGAIVSVNEACISLGFLLAFIVGAVLAPSSSQDEPKNAAEDNNALPPPNGWRYMFGIGGVLAFIQFLGMWTMPESPIWLREQGRLDESKAAVRRIHGRDELPLEDHDGSDNKEKEHEDVATTATITETTNRASFQQHIHRKSPLRCPRDAMIASNVNYESLSSVTSAACEVPESTALTGCWKIQHQCRTAILQCHAVYFRVKHVFSMYRRQVWIALFLSVAQQFCGQTSVLNYAPTILQAVVKQDNAATNGTGDGASDEVSGWATLSIGVVKFIATVLVIWKIEVVGRRRLLLVGMGTIAFGLLLIAVAFSANSSYLEEKQEAAGNNVVETGSGIYFALPGVLLVVSGYSMSFGPLTWLLTSELFPTDIRGRALGTSTIVTYLCAALVTYSFLTAQAVVGTTVVFLMYMLVTLLGMVFTCSAIPDTGGKTLEEIDTDLAKMPFWKNVATSSFWSFCVCCCYGDSGGDESDEPKQRRVRRRDSEGLGMVVDTPVASTFHGSGRLAEMELT